jgi:hypothetical protein
MISLSYTIVAIATRNMLANKYPLHSVFDCPNPAYIDLHVPVAVTKAAKPNLTKKGTTGSQGLFQPN